MSGLIAVIANIVIMGLNVDNQVHTKQKQTMLIDLQREFETWRVGRPNFNDGMFNWEGAYVSAPSPTVP